MKPIYDGVIFDFDGTLADTQKDVWDSVQYGAQAVGGVLTKEFCSLPHHLSLPLEDIFKEIQPPVPEKLFPLFNEAVNHHYRVQQLYPYTCLYEGIETILAKLNQWGAVVCIATMKGYEATSRILKLKKWEPYFTAWYCPDGPGDWLMNKGEMVGHLLKGPLAGTKALLVGDSPGDVQAARLNKIDSLGILYGDWPKQAVLEQKPDFYGYSAADVERVLFGNTSG